MSLITEDKKPLNKHAPDQHLDKLKVDPFAPYSKV